MKKGLVLVSVLVLAVGALLFSGCVGQSKTVKNGDNISVDYIGRTADGKVFDTSIESVAKQNNIYIPGKKYQEYKFTVGKGDIIKGFDEGVIGMKVGDKKTLTIPPEKAYGPIDPKKIQVVPIIQSIPATATIPKVVEVPADMFTSSFGQHHIVGDIVNIPETNINLTIKSIGTNYSLVQNLTVGYEIHQKGAPWNETVVSMDDNNITLRIDLKKGDVVNIQNVPWNTTIIDVNSTNITLKHNAIPDVDIPRAFGNMKVHFNETSIILDQNNKLAGKTLIFDITLKSIN